MRRPALLAALLGAATVLMRRRGRAQKAERELWTEAAKAPDLR
ncbi:MAG: DLW-39 family protein [Mycobacteriales bacterium]